jgi:hypothetical protein
MACWVAVRPALPPRATPRTSARAPAPTAIPAPCPPALSANVVAASLLAGQPCGHHGRRKLHGAALDGNSRAASAARAGASHGARYGSRHGQDRRSSAAPPPYGPNRPADSLRSLREQTGEIAHVQPFRIVERGLFGVGVGVDEIIVPVRLGVGIVLAEASSRVLASGMEPTSARI